MSRAHEQEQAVVDLQFAFLRLCVLSPHRDPKKPAPKLEDFVLFPTSSKVAKSEQTPEEQLAYVQNFLHPYFEARHEYEEKQAALGASSGDSGDAV